MADNPSFVLRGIDDVVYEQRPIPERTSLYAEHHPSDVEGQANPAGPDDVVVEVKKTGELSATLLPRESQRLIFYYDQVSAVLTCVCSIAFAFSGLTMT